MKTVDDKKKQCIELMECTRTGKELTLRQLEHLSDCEDCMVVYMDFIEDLAITSAPHYLKETILTEAFRISRKQETRQRIEQQLNTKRMQLFRYSMKVGLAMCGALFLLFSPDIFGRGEGRLNCNSSSQNGYIDWQKDSDTSGIYSFLNKINNGLLNFTDNNILDELNQERIQKEEPLK